MLRSRGRLRRTPRAETSWRFRTWVACTTGTNAAPHRSCKRHSLSISLFATRQRPDLRQNSSPWILRRRQKRSTHAGDAHRDWPRAGVGAPWSSGIGLGERGAAAAGAGHETHDQAPVPPRATDCFGSPWPEAGGTGARLSCSCSRTPSCGGIATGSAADGPDVRKPDGTALHRSISRSASSSERWRRQTRCGAHGGLCTSTSRITRRPRGPLNNPSTHFRTTRRPTGYTEIETASTATCEWRIPTRRANSPERMPANGIRPVIFPSGPGSLKHWTGSNSSPRQPVRCRNLVTPPGRTREPPHRDDRDAEHKPRPTPSPAPPADESGGAA
jgi:hypothetical protein